jgi:hypothetical protein
MSSFFYTIPFIASKIVFLGAIGFFAYCLAKPGLMKKKKIFEVTRNAGKNLMYFSLMLLAAVWLLRFAVGNWCYAHPDETGEIVKMGWGSQIFNSFVHALQTFSMDESYTAYMDNGMKLAEHLSGGKYHILCVLYLSAMNVIAPVAGGAFVFEILAGIFPQLRYLLSRGCWWKTRYYFTALNEPSLALAKSIVQDPESGRPLIVFTDAYADDEEEKSSELLLSAKALGAICLKDDLLHIPLKKLGKKKTYFFLSDREENENLQTLSQLLAMPEQDVLDNTDISVFGTDKRASCIEDEVSYLHNRLTAAFEKDGREILPNIIPINGIRNMAQRLFSRLPLFEGLYGKTPGNQCVNLTIVGSGVIGTEMFLNAYWFGQIAGVELNITVISADETEEEFRARIDSINPDIMATEQPGSEILNAYIGPDRASGKPVPQPRYFRFRFRKTNVLHCSSADLLKTPVGEDGFRLRDTDYFIVAVGSDENNFRIADMLRQEIGYYHANEAKDRKTIISYVIYNTSLCDSLNKAARQKHTAADGAGFDLYMHAFGSMEEIYSVDNILRSNRMARTASGDGAPEKDRIRPYNDDMGRALKTREYYNKRARLARQLQLRYKAFAAGILTPTLFCSESDEAYQAYMNEKVWEYARGAHGEWTYPEYTGIANRLAWMEHRRWNAFMRIYGFRRPDDISKYMKLNSDVHCLKDGYDKDYQFLFIKRHPCVVECDLLGYPGMYSRRDEAKRKGSPDPLGPDELDVLNKTLKKDFKKYDYPEDDVKHLFEKDV